MNHLLTQQIATWLASLLPPGRPRRISRMNGPNASAKYCDIPAAPSYWLHDHAAGRQTYAATLDLNGVARLGVIDIDEGGQPAVQALLVRLADAGLIAFAIAVETPGGHCGGHVFVVYTEFGDANTIHAQLAAFAPEGAEIWPSRQVIRLPFGVHRLARTRGQLLTQNGDTFNLDDPDQLATAWAALQTLPTNTQPAVQETPTKPMQQATPILPLPTQRRDGQLDARATIAQFNATHPLEQLLANYGAQHTRDGFTCPCGVAHTHTTTLTISCQGRLFSYSPRCRWYTDKGLDAFGLFCLVEHGGATVAALKAITPAPRERPSPAARVAPNGHHTAAAHKCATRASSAAATRAAIEARAAQDEDLSESAQVVVCALLDVAGERDWCRPSVPALATLIRRSVRTVHRALRELEAANYIVSGPLHGPGRTTIRHFMPLEFDAQTLPDAQQPACTLVEETRACVPMEEELAIRSTYPEVTCLPASDVLLAQDTLCDRHEHVVHDGRACEGSRDEPVPLPLSELTARRSHAVMTPESLTAASLDDLLIGPDGALAYPQGAAWLPTDAAVAWWESLACCQSQAEPEDGGVFDPPAAVEPILPLPQSPHQPKRDTFAQYRRQTAEMDTEQLAAEQRKHQRTIQKFTGAHWLADIHTKLRILGTELAKRTSYTTALPSQPVRSQPGSVSAAQLSLFDNLIEVPRASSPGVYGVRQARVSPTPRPHYRTDYVARSSYASKCTIAFTKTAIPRRYVPWQEIAA